MLFRIIGRTPCVGTIETAQVTDTDIVSHTSKKINNNLVFSHFLLPLCTDIVVPKTKKQSIGLLSFLVAGVGFFIALPSRIVVCRASPARLGILLALWGIASSKRHTVAFWLAHPRPPPEAFGAIRPATKKTRQTNGLPCLFVLYRLNRCHPQKVNKIKGF